MDTVRFAVRLAPVLCLTATVFAFTAHIAAQTNPSSVPGLVSPVSPGVAWFRVESRVGDNRCVTYRSGNILRPPYFAVGGCTGMAWGSFISDESRDTPSAPMVVVPDPSGTGFTIRAPGGMRQGASPVAMDFCATVSRNLNIGPAGLDILPCDGGRDQIFTFAEAGAIVPRASGPAAHLTDRDFQIVSAATRACVDVRGNSTAIGTELILYQCNGQPNQTFHFAYTLGGQPYPPHVVNTPNEVRIARLLGYMPDAGGVYWRAAVINGWDIPGLDLPGSPFASRNGQECASSCVANADCSAFTFVNPPRSGASGQCWLKGSVPPQAVRNPNTASGVIRTHSGVVVH